MKFLLVILSICTVGLAQDAIEFSERGWQAAAPVYEAIRKHPFNQELASGTLPAPKFARYQAQDAFYLIEFARALGTLGTKLADPKEMQAVFQLSADCFIEMNRRDKNGKRDDATAVTPSPATLEYTRFLLATAVQKSPEELAAALLPCFWIYLRLAQELKTVSPKKNPYRAWIEEYSGKAYARSVEKMIGITDRLAKNASPEINEKMIAAFVAATQFEKRFWDGAYGQ